MGLFRSYVRSLKPLTKDDRRRAFQTQQWRNRVDAQMRGSSGPERTVACPNCSCRTTFPRPGTWTCTQCGYKMAVSFGKDTTTVRQVGCLPMSSTRPLSTAGELERLAELHKTGAITDVEFAAAKAKIIGI